MFKSIRMWFLVMNVRIDNSYVNQRVFICLPKKIIVFDQLVRTIEHSFYRTPLIVIIKKV